MYQMYLKGPAFESAVQRAVGRVVRIAVKIGEAVEAKALAKPAQAAMENEAAGRALEHPEVRRFQELFPDSQVRTVRNLRENGS